jgi:hypothetical protein
MKYPNKIDRNQREYAIDEYPEIHGDTAERDKSQHMRLLCHLRRSSLLFKRKRSYLHRSFYTSKEMPRSFNSTFRIICKTIPNSDRSLT